MLSRVAESIYWMHRYIERAENYARFMTVNFNLALELPPTISEQWSPLVTTTGDIELFNKHYQKANRESVIFFMTFDRENPNSIINCIFNAREIARSIRPDITNQVWEQINELHITIKNKASKITPRKAVQRTFFSNIRKACQLLYGIFDATISRHEGWHFAKMGQLIERADKTSRVLDVKYHIILPSLEEIGSTIDLIHWTALLKSVSAYDMYLKKYGKLNPLMISKFLILDKEFPRSILRCLLIAQESLRKITGNFDGYTNEAEKKLGALKSELEFTDIIDIFDQGLHEYLDKFQLKLNEVSDSIDETYFSHKHLIST